MKKSLVGQKVGNYEIVSLLGKGGMGEVYVARHPVLDRTVAVKVLSRALSDDEDLVARFRQEAQSAGRIGHEAIVEITDFGELEDDRCYYVMELLHGLSLQEYLDKNGTVDVAEAVAILRPILEALAAAHAAGIVHRDIKPDNIFLHRDGRGRIKPKLLDFGIAKLMDPTEADSGVATRTGQLLGTPLYMSPEQAAGETQNIGPWSDVYSVSAVLFRMLTGEPPFKAKSFGALLVKHLQEPPPNVTTMRPDLPSVLDGLIQGGMAKETDKRCQTVRSFLKELEGDVPSGEAIPESIVLPKISRQMATEPTMRVDSSLNLSPTALASTTPANLHRAAAESEELEASNVSATGRTSLSSAAAEQLPARLPLENPPRGSKGLLYGGIVAAVLVLAVAFVWGLGGFDRNQSNSTPPSPTVGMARPTPMAMHPPPKRPARPTASPKWVRIHKPAKPVVLGLAKVAQDEPYFRLQAGLHCCDKAFDIQEHEVTWAAYEAWAKSNRARMVKPPAHVPTAAARRKRLPVVGVAWSHALAYCQSLGATLPTEAQYEYAARGPTLGPNPWGAGPVDLLRTALLVGKSPSLRAVCSADQDVIRHAGHRLCDLAANALEWTLGPFVNAISPNNPPAGFPFGGLQSRHWRAVRGLPLLQEKDRVPRAASLYRAPGCVSSETCKGDHVRKQLLYTGFRCVRNVPSSK
jgi:eukaryotic-like serine/threonine-protein kinase